MSVGGGKRRTSVGKERDLRTVMQIVMGILLNGYQIIPFLATA